MVASCNKTANQHLATNILKRPHSIILNVASYVGEMETALETSIFGKQNCGPDNKASTKRTDTKLQ